MIDELLIKNTSKSYTERIMIFDDWEESFPVITPKKVKTPVEATTGFFNVPKQRRNLRLNYTEQYEDKTKVYMANIRRTPYTLKYLTADTVINPHERLVIRYLNVPNISRGLHISVRDYDNPDLILGHDKYSYR